MTASLGTVLAVLLVGGFALMFLVAANRWRKARIRARSEVVWPGGHVATPVRRLDPGYGYNDPGVYVWKWRCKYCGEEHRSPDRFGEVCPID